MKAPIDDYAANISTEGDYTVNLDLRSTVSESVFGWTLAGLPLDTPAPVFKKYVNSFKEATTEDEMKAVRKRLTGFKFREPLANGPGKIKLESLSSASTLTMPVNEKHPHADAINWNGWKGQLLPSNQKEWQALSAGALDGTQTFMPPNVAAGMPDFVHIHVIDQWVGEALAVNHRRKPFDNRKFRQAMSHIIKSENIANKVAGDSKMKFPRKYFTGTSRSIHKEFLTPIEDQLTIYGQGDTKKAASLLKEAGFSKQKGQWMMPNGNAVKFTIKTDSCCNDWVDGARTAAAHLSQFGIKAQFTTMEGAALWSDFSEGNFDVIGANWGSYGKRAAYFDYRFEFNSRPASTGFDPTSVQIDSLPNGEGGKLNLKEMAAELSQLTGADAKNRIQDLAYAYDQVQPQIMLMEKASQTFMTTDQWEFPSLDNPNMWIKWPHYWLPKNGLLKAKEKE